MNPDLQFELDPWIKWLRPAAGAKVRLLYFPAAGASAVSGLSWRQILPPYIDALGVQLPGRGERFQEPPISDLRVIVRALVAATRPLRDRPYVLFGHSLGALIAFELTRALRRNSERLPIHLFAAAHRAPQVPQTDPPVHQLPEGDFVAELLRLGGMAPEILADRDLMELLLPALRADFAIHETYTYVDEPPLACPITACGGLEDAEVSFEELAAWRQQTSSAFELRRFKGGHFFVHSEGQALIETINTKLPQYRHLV